MIDALGGDGELRERFVRYQVISQALKHDLPAQTTDNLAARVAEALANEPTVLAPRQPLKAVRQVLHHVGGLALAASLTAVAILGIQSLTEDVQPTPAPQVASAQDGDWIRVSGTRWEDAAPGVESRLNTYFVNHSEYAGSTGMPGMLPYAKIVGYDAGGTEPSSR